MPERPPRLRFNGFSNRTRVLLLSASAIIITFGPIAGTLYPLHGVVHGALTEVHPATKPAAPEYTSSTDSTAVHQMWFDASLYASPSEAISAYKAQRNPIVDALLPEGEGGTRFFADLRDAAGIAVASRMLIGISIAALGTGSEVTEIHERAHLLHSVVAEDVAELIRALPRPAANRYAAKNSAEHFAEMASKAWEILVPPKHVCTTGALELLHQSEADVPGTAGFVVMFGEHAVFDDLPERDSLLAAARMHSVATQAVWGRIRARVEGQRLESGKLLAWKRPSVLDELRAWRVQRRSDGGWLGRVEAVLLWPSIWVASAARL